MKKVAVPQAKARLTVPPPMRPVRKGPQAPQMQAPGQEVDNSLPAGTQVAGFSDHAGMPRSKPGVRKAAQVANGNRPARPLTPKFEAMTFGSGPTNPFR
jgi:hypothetical protein